MRQFNFIKAVAISDVVRPLLQQAFMVVVAAFLFIASGLRSNTHPFSKYGGNWTGGGFLHLSDETKERISCRARFHSFRNLSHDFAGPDDSYNFNVLSDLSSDGRMVSGEWSESNLGINGTVSGQMLGDNLQAVIESMAFTATFELTIAGEKQQVKILSPGSQISAVVIWLNRTKIAASL